jgi:hypothetical protein
MTEATATMTRTLAMLSHVRHDRKGQRALLRDRVLRVLVTDLASRDSRAPRLVGPFLPSADEGAGE